MELIVWVNTYSRKQCMSLFRKTRAAFRKAMKNGSKRQLEFQYDPLSYALNFDDGCSYRPEDGSNAVEQAKLN